MTKIRRPLPHDRFFFIYFLGALLAGLSARNSGLEGMEDADRMEKGKGLGDDFIII